MRLIALAVMPLALTACVSNIGTEGRPVYANVGKENPRVRGVENGTCDQAKLDATGGFIGQEASTELGGDMMKASGAGKLQWIAHGSAVTMDYREDRLRVQLDENSRIVSHICG